MVYVMYKNEIRRPIYETKVQDACIKETAQQIADSIMKSMLAEGE